MSARRAFLVGLAAVALLLVAGRVGGALYVDHAWYAAMGAEPLWRAKVLNTLLLRGITALLGTAFVFANLYSVRHSIVSLVLPRRVGDLEIGEEVPGRTLMAGVFLLSAALGALLTIPYGDWTLLAQAWRGRPFGELDPYHQVDIGFWVHWLPLETALYHWALLVLLVVSIVVVALYALTPSLRWDRGTLRVTNYVRRHLVVLGALALLLLGWSYRLDQYRLLVAGTGDGGQFTWSDHHVRVTANAVLGLVAVVMAGLVLLTGWMGQMRRAFVAVTLVLVASVVMRQALPAILERTRAPREAEAREGPYQRTRAAYSRRAVGLELDAERRDAGDTVRLGPVAAAGTLSATVEGSSAWDARALAQAVMRARRGSVRAGAVGWRAGERGLEALVVARPASDASSDPATAWAALRIDASASMDGAPDAIERPLPPPLVWPGARGWAIIDDPSGRVPAARLSSATSRLAHAWGQQNLRFLDAGLSGAGTRLVLRRDVRERVEALAPFFVQGSEVTPVLTNGALYWILPLYAASDWYPVSAPIDIDGQEWRSWRHAATAVVDAGTGRVRMVAAPRRDSLGETWIRLFPSLFTPLSTLPADLAAQLPADVDGALVRAAIVGLAGTGRRGEMAGARRELADGAGDTLVAVEPTPFLAAGVPAVALPLVDGGGTLSGVLVSTGGARPRTSWIATTGSAIRWDATRDRLLRGADSASAARDGRVLPGALRVLPVGDGAPAFLLSQYRWRGDGPPELARVSAIVADSVQAGATLAAALGIAAPPGTPPAPGLPPGDGSARAAVLYERMRDAMRRGDWRAFGEAFDALGATLGRPPR